MENGEWMKMEREENNGERERERGEGLAELRLLPVMTIQPVTYGTITY